MKMTEFKELMALSKGFKIFLGVLSVVAVAAFSFAFIVAQQSKDEIYTAKMTLQTQRLVLSTDSQSEFSYNARLHFPHLAFLLRSKTLSSVEITKFSWSENINLNLMSDLYNEGRGVFFTSAQNLKELASQNLGSVEYKVNFAPFFETILTYYLIISFLTGILYVVALFYVKQHSSCIIGGGDFCQSDFTSKISLFACLYLFFFTLNFIFPTQSDDIDGVFGGLSAAINSYIGWNGRIGELLRVAFGASFAHTPFYAFINAFIAVVLLYLFFVLIFARLPLTQNKGKFSKFNDISVICFMLICLFAFSGFGSVFYWAAGSFNYLWAWTLILAWCVPYRLFWGAVWHKFSKFAQHKPKKPKFLRLFYVAFKPFCWLGE